MIRETSKGFNDLRLSITPGHRQSAAAAAFLVSELRSVLLYDNNYHIDLR